MRQERKWKVAKANVPKGRWNQIPDMSNLQQSQWAEQVLIVSTFKQSFREELVSVTGRCLAIAIYINEGHGYVQKAREELWRERGMDFRFWKKKKSEFNSAVFWDLTGCKQKLMWSSTSSLRMRSCCSRCGLRSRFMRSWKKQEGRGQV